MKEHLVTLETTPGAAVNRINEICEHNGPFGIPRDGIFGEEVFFIGYPHISGDGSFFVLEFDARIEEADYPNTGNRVNRIIRITISPLGEHRSQVFAQTEMDIFEGFLDRLINKLVEMFNTPSLHQREDSKPSAKKGGRPRKPEYEKIYRYLGQGYSLPRAMSEEGLDSTDPNVLDKVKKAMKRRNSRKD